jgi:hypothetical protein
MPGSGGAFWVVDVVVVVVVDDSGLLRVDHDYDYVHVYDPDLPPGVGPGSSWLRWGSTTFHAHAHAHGSRER